jgi:transglutaminase-like putative cysteine protease
MAERFSRVAVAGLLLTGLGALAASGYFGWMALAGAGAAAAGLGWAVWRLGPRARWAGPAAIGAAFLELLAAALVSASPVFFLLVGAFVLLLAGALVGDEIRRSSQGAGVTATGGLQRFHFRLAGLVACVSASALLLTAVFFLALPRTARAAFQRLFQERRAPAGLAAEVRLGEMGRRFGRDDAAMHVRIVDAEGPLELKWRGVVLTTFDGVRWRAETGTAERLAVNRDRVILADDEQRRRPGRRITYEVRLEPLATEVLFLAGYPEVLWIGAPVVSRAEAGFYRVSEPPRERLRYGAVSFLDPVGAGERPGPRYLQLPRLDPRIAELARKVTAFATTDETRAFALEQYLRANYEYSLDGEGPASKDPLAEFLFEKRRGHCEYFASALAVMLRTLKIPSRVVTGFQSGRLNPLNGWYVMRDSDAHAWVEAWMPAQGWTAWDATPVRAAERGPSVLKGLYAYLDAADLFWQEWVMGYGFSQQVALAAKVQSSGRDLGARWLERTREVAGSAWSSLSSAARRFGWLAAAMGLAGWAIGTAAPRAVRWARAQRRIRLVAQGRGDCSDASLLYERMLKLLEQSGYAKPGWFTPDEFVRALPRGAAAERVSEFTKAYQAARFGGKQAAVSALPGLLEEVRKAARPSGASRIGTA